MLPFDEATRPRGQTSVDLDQFLLYNNFMGRPRNSGKNTAMVNGRITAEQMEWLLARADELGGNLSAALRQTITDARVLEMMRVDFRTFEDEHPDFDVPATDEGVTWGWKLLMRMPMTESADLELREEEAGEQ
jgi:hypothetical protein